MQGGAILAEIRTLTGLRGYAALWVMFFHYTAGLQGDGVLLAIARQGMCGLTTFFVLSGFILAHVYAERFRSGVDRAGYRDFLWARFARIYPLHLATLLAWLVLVPPQPQDTAFAFALNLVLLQSWGFINPLNWNQPSWSVSIEFFAYLVFPFLISIALRGGWLVRIGLFVLACWSVWYMPYSQLVSPLVQRLGAEMSGLVFLYGFSLFQWFFIFCVGAFAQPLARFALERIRATWVWDGLFLAGVGLFLWLCADPTRLGVAVPAALLVTIGLYPDKGLGRRLAGNRVAVFLGDISFALYLTHYLLLWVWPLYFGVVDPPLFSAKVPVAILVAAAVHHLFERPVRSWLRRQAPGAAPRRGAPAAAGAIGSS